MNHEISKNFEHKEEIESKTIKIKIKERDYKGKEVITEYSFEIKGDKINWDSIVPHYPPEVMFNGEWIRNAEFSELYKGADQTPYVEALKFEDGTIYKP